MKIAQSDLKHLLYKTLLLLICLVGGWGLVGSAEAAPAGNKVSNESTAYESIPYKTRAFWQNLKPLAKKQDLNTFQLIVTGMSNHLNVQTEIVNVKQPQEIPFEELSAEYAEKVAQGNHVYKGGAATLRVTPAYMKFYNDVIFPKICAFFEPLAVSVARSSRPWTVGGGEYRRYTQFKTPGVYASDTRSFRFPDVRSIVVKEGYCNVVVARVKNPDAVLRARVGERVEAEVVVFHLPQAYSSFYTSLNSAEKGFPVYAHLQDADGKYIWSTNKHEVFCCGMWYEGKWMYEIPFSDFYLPEESASRMKHCLVNLKSDEETYPYLKQEREQARQAEMKRKREEIRKEESSPLYVCIYLGLTLLGISWVLITCKMFKVIVGGFLKGV